jgi:hypothetical protein
MAEPEAAWRAELKRIGDAQFRDSLNGGLTEQPKQQKSFRWRGDQGEARRLRDEHTYHYVRWTLVAAVAAVIVSLIVFGLTFLH